MYIMIVTGATGGLAFADNLLAAVPVGLLGLLLLVQVAIKKNRPS